MEKLRATINETIQFTDIVIQDRIRRRQETGLRGVPWKEDESLKAVVTDLRSQSQVVSHSAVKFALLANMSSPTDSNASKNLDSIGDETVPIIVTFYNIFLRLTECAIAECLFDEAAQCVRSMLGIYAELLHHIAERKRDAVSYTAGEMTKVLSEVAEQLPLSNKVAYRRYCANKCKSFKEIVDEFSGYVEEARTAYGVKDSAELSTVFQNMTVTDIATGKPISLASAAAAMGTTSAAATPEDEDEGDGDGEADDADEDMDERDYFPTEVPLVEGAIALIQQTLAYSKVFTITMTNIADNLVGSADTSKEELTIACNTWVVSQLVHIDQMESMALDLGAALYPPVLKDNEDLVSSYSALYERLVSIVDALHDGVASGGAKYGGLCDPKIIEEIVKLRDRVKLLPPSL